MFEQFKNWLRIKLGAAPECSQCELLKEQLNFANYERKILLEKVLEQAFPNLTSAAIPDVEGMEPIKNPSRFVPWRVRQQQLQEDSRKRARELKPEPKEGAPRTVTPESIEKLETELGVQHVREAVQGNP